MRPSNQTNTKQRVSMTSPVITVTIETLCVSSGGVKATFGRLLL